MSTGSMMAAAPILGVLGVVTAIVAYIRREPKRAATCGLLISVGAILVQVVLIVTLIIAGAIILVGIMKNMDSILGGSGPRPDHDCSGLRGRVTPFRQAIDQGRRGMAFGKGHHLHLIDGSAFIFRAYHALPPLTRKSDGLPIGAVVGLLQHAATLCRGQQRPGCADPCGGDLRQGQPHLPQRHLRPVQGQPRGHARGPAPAVPADPRRHRGLQHRLQGEGRLRGRRHHRHLAVPGARGRRAGARSSVPTRT